jgi:hypothetical protein
VNRPSRSFCFPHENSLFFSVRRVPSRSPPLLHVYIYIYIYITYIFALFFRAPSPTQQEPAAAARSLRPMRETKSKQIQNDRKDILGFH